MEDVDNSEVYHPRCSRSFFGIFPPPKLEVTLDNIRDFAARSITARSTVTGVQKKLSVGLQGTGREQRLTIVGLWGTYILKPPTAEYPHLPENEDTIMHCASALGIPVVPHALIPLASGELAYITRRIDRRGTNEKIAMEDFCQLSERLTEDKYKGSVEKAGKLILRHSIYAGLDITDFFERILFSFLVGNADMHLKNYSLIKTPQGMRLSPAYDLLSTRLAIPEDQEESALTINGKKSKLDGSDFISLARNLDIPKTVQSKLFRRFIESEPVLLATVNKGRLPDAMKHALTSLICKRLKVIANS
jgi:serine/threonine-protein kinase HipA